MTNFFTLFVDYQNKKTELERQATFGKNVSNFLQLLERNEGDKTREAFLLLPKQNFIIANLLIKANELFGGAFYIK
jgi:hypothetical protein